MSAWQDDPEFNRLAAALTEQDAASVRDRVDSGAFPLAAAYVQELIRRDRKQPEGTASIRDACPQEEAATGLEEYRLGKGVLIKDPGLSHLTA